MIQLLTKVNIIDNSGGSIGKCIKILNPHGRNYAKVGDIILVTIKETLKLSSNNPNSQNKVTKGSLYKALIVRTKIGNNKNTGNFEDNAVILLKSNTNSKIKNEISPLGTRIKGPISIKLSSPLSLSINPLGLKKNDKKEKFSENKYQKVLSLSKLHY